MQVQGTIAFEALQAVCASMSFAIVLWLMLRFSFELGGDKKTKGAALVFVSIMSSLRHLTLLAEFLPVIARCYGDIDLMGFLPVMYSHAFCYAQYANMKHSFFS